MSLLSFVMPEMFGENTSGLKLLFSSSGKTSESASVYEKEKTEHAKRIMKPFVLRRLKANVLKQLPKKTEKILKCELSERQRELYDKLFISCSTIYRTREKGNTKSGLSLLMDLRKMSNHPCLLRDKYNNEKLMDMARDYCKDPKNRDSEVDLVYEDMTVMSDFELHQLTLEETNLNQYSLSTDVLMDSGKFKTLDTLLPELKSKGDRVLIFSQFTIMMDILEPYLRNRGHRFLRIDGHTPVAERQGLIDKFNQNENIFIFLLSTRAGGLGINLTAANTVILHDIDFNPYNDKQAEDRCHRVGQTREVTIYKLICQNTVDEAMLKCAERKLQLEQDLAGADKDNDSDKDVATVLHQIFDEAR